MAEKKVTKATLNKSFWRWFYGNLTCFTQEHMQTFGYMWSMLPIIQELYSDKAEQQEKLRTYSPFFNTEPQIGSIQSLSVSQQVLKKLALTAQATSMMK